MPLTNVYKAIAPLEKELPVRRWPAKAWNATEFERGTPEELVMSLAPIPLSPRDLKNLDSGEFSLQDMKFYQNAQNDALSVNDQIQKNGVWFTIRKPPFDRSDDGGYRIYFAKRDFKGQA